MWRQVLRHALHCTLWDGPACLPVPTHASWPLVWDAHAAALAWRQAGRLHLHGHTSPARVAGVKACSGRLRLVLASNGLPMASHLAMSRHRPHGPFWGGPAGGGSGQGLWHQTLTVLAQGRRLWHGWLRSNPPKRTSALRMPCGTLLPGINKLPDPHWGMLLGQRASLARSC